MTHVSADSHTELDNIAVTLTSAKRVIVLVGAGVSTSAGIPDFRSKNGLRSLGIRFDVQNLRPNKRASFLTHLTHLRQQARRSRPTLTHHFLQTLKKKGQLLRCYTQNVDMLERAAGFSVGLSEKDTCVALHGELRMLRCSLCQRLVDWRTHEANILAGSVPSCCHCTQRRDQRVNLGRRPTPVGYLRPDIVLVDEEHPHSETIGSIISKDLRTRPDFLLLLGSSLVHSGPKRLAKELSRSILQNGGTVVVVNTNPPSHKCWRSLATYTVQWDCDSLFTDLQKRTLCLGTTQEVPRRITGGTDEGSENNPIILD